MPAESKLEERCRIEAERRGYWMPKWVAPGSRGVMDRILFRPIGRVTFIEFKAKGKKLRKLQSFMADMLRAYGCEVVSIDTYEDFLELLND